MEPEGDARHQGRQVEGSDAQPAPAVSLRPLGLEDVDAFMSWAADDRVMRHLKRPLCATREEAVAQISDTVLGHPWFRAICVDGGQPVGQVNVWPYADEGGHRGRGIATATIRMVVGRVFEELPGLERLEAVTDVENARSQRALEMAGFQREGVLRSYIVRRGPAGVDARDAAVYSFLSSDRTRLA